VLIATDLAARGLDIPGLPCVIHFHPPLDFSRYMHRAGRTARGGASGESILLVNAEEGKTHLTKWKRLVDFESRATVTAEDLKKARFEKIAQELLGVQDSKIFRPLCPSDLEISLAKILCRLDRDFAGERKKQTLKISGIKNPLEASIVISEILGTDRVTLDPSSGGGYTVTLESTQAKMLLGSDLRLKLESRGWDVSVFSLQENLRRKKLPWETAKT
jgi:superfamily II DNA/RNA helicase